ncbi:MAG TPA: FAD/NAD(P)-binding oxidoreductase [Mycobacteriales bacterium]|nr:FAD/NAD(P)-binding oxidoreductase [Mycobacteriales bacterium]
MTRQIVILGGGTGGTLLANRLDRTLSRTEARITVVDRDDDHLYQPGLLFVPFGAAHSQRLVRRRSAQLRPGVSWRQATVDRVDVDERRVHLADGSELPYDVLVIATGARLLAEETEGLTGPGWNERVFTFYTAQGAGRLGRALRLFTGGRLVVNVIDMPIKCPVAPLEFCFLADAYFRRRGIRDDVDIVYATPLDSAFTKPVAAKTLGALLQRKRIGLVTEFNTGEVNGAAGRLTAYDGREIDFDLAAVVPLHAGADFVGRTPGLGDALDFVMTDPNTLQAKVSPDVFALGDATDLTASKAGSVAHFEGEVLAANVAHLLRDEPLETSYDGHVNCFVETGDGKALLIDFNTDVEPVPGHFPGPVGLPLLAESRLNHWGKRAFEQIYWHGLLPGRDLPFVGAAMPRAGKRLPILYVVSEEGSE